MHRVHNQWRTQMTQTVIWFVPWIGLFASSVFWRTKKIEPNIVRLHLCVTAERTVFLYRSRTPNASIWLVLVWMNQHQNGYFSSQAVNTFRDVSTVCVFFFQCSLLLPPCPLLAHFKLYRVNYVNMEIIHWNQSVNVPFHSVSQVQQNQPKTTATANVSKNKSK